MKNVGLITYHSAYNYGSALQAYATQHKIEELGCKVEIVNYRMPSQRDFYTLYRKKAGRKIFVLDNLMRPFEKKRKLREDRFEKFFSKYMNLTKEFNYPEDLNCLKNMYDVVVSGSDQIWNVHSCEIEYASNDFILPYFLTWAGDSRRVSYATSISRMTKDEMKPYIAYMQKYENISVREKSAKDLISNLLNREVNEVLDPTLLLRADEWYSLFLDEKTEHNNYILVYSLKGPKAIACFLKELKKCHLAKEKKIIVLSPFAAVFDRSVIYVPEAGPLEFLNLIKNASGVITDSYHGTLFSINFHIPFFCMGVGKTKGDTRRNEILSKLGLQGCLFDEIYELRSKNFYLIDWDEVDLKLDSLRNISVQYLKESL